MLNPKKRLGQHWLRDADILESIADDASVSAGDHVFEVGPGEGYLTRVLLDRGADVTALEFDPDAIEHIRTSSRLKCFLNVEASRFPELVSGSRDTDLLDSETSSENRKASLNLIPGDIRSFDYNQLPKDFKICANIPYYLTANLLSNLAAAANKPSEVALLVQDEVALRYGAPVGETKGSLAVLIDIFFERSTGTYVPRELFTPPPKVDSRVIVLKRRDKSLIPESRVKDFERLLKFAFISPRKVLKKNLSVGYQRPVGDFLEIFQNIGINELTRAEALTIEQWIKRSTMPEDDKTLPCADKMAFDTSEEATASATVLRARDGVSLKAYQCSLCGLWHLTSN
jgi:16S rRNA (adenine1518-N6/adenine1519-N6)-dimethyltransferase